MGANAQIAVPAFVANQVLTAAQQTQINTGIPVFATTVTRDAAFGGAGEKVLAQGQYAYIEATSTLQVYNGSAWVSAITTGLTYLTGATFSAVSSVSLPTNTFTSTYTNYKVIFVIDTADATRQVFSRLRASGTDSTLSNYNNASGGSNSAGSFVAYGALSQSSWSYPYAGAAGNKFVLVVDVLQPQIAQNTYLTGNALGLNAAASNYDGVSVNQLVTNQNQFDAMTFFVSAGNMTGNYTVYGYAKS